MSTLAFLITGANRGLGLGYVKELLKRGHSVIACCRNPDSAKELRQLRQEFAGKIELIEYEVTSQESAKKAAATLEKSALGRDGIHVLISNAGVLLGGLMNCFTEREDPISDLRESLEINTIGTLNTILAFLPLLRKKQGGKKRIFVVTTQGASLGHEIAQTPTVAPYCVSKAAANMIALKFMAELEPEGFFVAPFHPGSISVSFSLVVRPLTATDMNKFVEFGGRLDVTKAAKMGVDVFLGVKSSDNGKFLSYDGTVLPW
ncbi:hypothetical protein ACM66B_001774 [Microbotryomycetes sp. NB124-2]